MARKQPISHFSDFPFLLRGLLCAQRFEINGQVIERPPELSKTDGKHAFNEVGKYLADPSTDVLLKGFQDISLQRDQSQTPLEVWHQVLEYFEKQGAIEKRWELRLPTDLTRPSHIPTHWEWTPEFSTRTAVHHQDGTPISPSSESLFNPRLLTDEQKDALMGSRYKLHPLGAKLYRKQSHEDTIVLEEKHFHMIFRKKSFRNT